MLFVLLNIASLSVEAISKVFQLRVLPLASSATGASPEHGFALASMALLGHGIAFNSADLFWRRLPGQRQCDLSLHLPAAHGGCA
ncbi:hypothetical protein, partial [Acinetobacter baumannii]|uniref:hypothetical protein n=1 Tax=Acinetobacter baumannii TaxID=470 RepID=UPI001EEFC407